MLKDSRRASVAGLKIVNQARQQLGWKKIPYSWYSKAEVSEPTLKRFWQRANILRDNFDRICQAVEVDPEEIWEREPELSAAREMEIFVLDDEWVGRGSLSTELLVKLQSSCRVVLLLGMTGIGKTSLAESLIIDLRGDWNELRENWENTSCPKDFVTVVNSWLATFGQKVSNGTKNSPEELLNQIIATLCNGRYLLLLDSFEHLLVGSEDNGWGEFADRWWGEFWRNLLSAPNCQSRIIITSQDFPTQLAQDCDRYPNLWQQEIITGLTTTEQQELFIKLELANSPDMLDSRLMLIGDIYAGHPLALRVIAGEIKQSYQNNFSAYWQENGHYIKQVEEDLLAAQENNQGKDDLWKLDSYTRQLRLRVRDRIKMTFQRLRLQIPIAHALICIASIYRGAVPDNFWKEQLEMEGYDQEQQSLAMITLQERFLVEDGGFDTANVHLISQHNLIRSIAITQRLEFYNGGESDE
jgi:hypothetical protein